MRRVVVYRLSSECPVEEKPNSEKSYVVASWPSSTPGHTGYLTVATLPPTFIRKKTNTMKSDPVIESQSDKLSEVTNNEAMAVDVAAT
ncbi:unnamed protein product [Parnassius apollo]|uniref:(apollo) hypothetical protein n=1 Tax=Parnassius apollo TaxID=110799 RepID=A0A8S3WEU3_PARAO|nr:unnamed protein product [Parnassius apollo]